MSNLKPKFEFVGHGDFVEGVDGDEVDVELQRRQVPVFFADWRMSFDKLSETEGFVHK
jgi:hypothetical protein